MRRKLQALTFVWFILGMTCLAQVSDEFNNPQTLQNGFWQGERSNFDIRNGQLVSTSQIVNDTFFVSTLLDSIFVSHIWELEFILQFRTSSANYVDFFLAADASDLERAPNALFVRIGNTQDDISLYRRLNGKDSILLDGSDRSVDLAVVNLLLHVKLEKGSLSVNYKPAGQQNFLTEGAVELSIPPQWKHSGIRIRQSTSSFFGKHFFERFYSGPPIQDLTYPSLIGWNFVNDTLLKLSFTEPINIPDTSQFKIIPGFQEPDILVINRNGNTLSLQFREIFPANKPLDLQISGIQDSSGNTMPDTVISIFRTQAESAERNDIVISELMPVPAPAVGLPEFEYIELYNRSNKWIDLGTFIVTDPVSRRSLPTYILKPDSFVVLYPEQAANALTGISGVLLVPSLPSLNNSGDQITLRRALDNAWIDGVSYTSDWFGSDFKASGGWSLERKNLDIPCSLRENWEASVHPSGGTPGKANSLPASLPILKDLESSGYGSDSARTYLRIDFSRELDFSAADLSRWNTEPFLFLDSLRWENEERTGLRFYFNATQMQKGVLYTLYNDSVYPCFGEPVRISISFGPPSMIEPGELLINEVLFNEPSGGKEYIELYNASDSLIDLSAVRLITRSGDGKGLSALIFTGKNVRLIPPREYVCISTETQKIASFYKVLYRSNMMEYQGSMDLSASEGYVLLFLSNGTLLDSLYYEEDMHYSLLKDPDGVSLERLSFSAPAWQKNNWTSASQISGFGTPGYKNSQLTQVSEEPGEMQLSTELISPDGDGYNDFMAISFKLSAESRMTLRVYHTGGFMIRSLLENAYAGNETQVFFDGLSEDGKPLSPGMYILMAEGFAPDGRVFRFKKAFGVAYR